MYLDYRNINKIFFFQLCLARVELNAAGSADDALNLILSISIFIVLQLLSLASIFKKQGTVGSAPTGE